jgi:phage pi2 protein 07
MLPEVINVHTIPSIVLCHDVTSVARESHFSQHIQRQKVHPPYKIQRLSFSGLHLRDELSQCPGKQILVPLKSLCSESGGDKSPLLPVSTHVCLCKQVEVVLSGFHASIPSRFVELGASTIDRLELVDVVDQQFVRGDTDTRAKLCMQSRIKAMSFASSGLVYQPEAAPAGHKWAWDSRQWMEVSVIHRDCRTM